jgi:hypothetical protein
MSVTISTANIKYEVIVPAGPPAFLTSDGYTEAWYSAEVANVTKDGSNLVSQWNDLSAHARHIVGTGTQRPTWTSTGILFSVTSNKLANSFSFSQPIYIYAVIQLHSWVNFGKIIVLNDDDFPYIQQRGGADDPPSGYGIAMTAGHGLEAYGTVLDDDYLFRFFINGVSSAQWWNGTEVISGDAGAGTMDEFCLGGESNDTTNMTVREVIMRSVTDAGANQTAIVDYWNTKYTIY